MASIKQKSSRKFKITVCNGYRPDGTKICRAKTVTVPDSVHPKRIHQYVTQAAAEMEREFQHGYSEDADTPFESFAEKWLARQVRYAPSTLAGYRAMLRSVYPFIGSVKVRNIKPITLENLAVVLRKKVWRGRVIQESTVQKYLEAVSSVLQDAVRNDILVYNPAHRLSLPRVEQKPQFIPSKEELLRLIDIIMGQEPVFRVYYILAIVTGCRRGELAALRWQDFDHEQGVLRISKSRSQIAGLGVVEGNTKNGKTRYISLDTTVQRLLMQLLVLGFRKEYDIMPDDYIFVDDKGKPFHPDTFSRKLRRILDQNDFNGRYHLHTLRHFCASLLLNDGVSNKVVADLLGHQDTAFLERTYGHPLHDYGIEAAQHIPALLLEGNREKAFQLIEMRPPEDASDHLLPSA